MIEAIIHRTMNCLNVKYDRNDFNYLIQGTNLGPSGKVVFYIFKKHDIYPVAVAKLVRDKEKQRIIDDEIRTISQLRNTLSVNMTGSMPEIIDVFDVSGFRVSLFRGIKGHFMDVGWKRMSVDISRTFTWLAEFQKETISSRVPVSEYVNSAEMNNARLKFEELTAGRYGNPLEEYADCNLILPSAFVHGDVRNENIFIERSKIKMIDWEFCERSSPSFFDVFYFPYSYLYVLTGDRTTAFHRAFIEHNKHSLMIKQKISEHLNYFGIKKENIDFLFLVFTLKILLRLHYIDDIMFAQIFENLTDYRKKHGRVF